MNTNGSWKLVTFAVLALLTASMGASLAHAQTIEGRFDLPLEVRWGVATLPPGHYSFTVNSPTLPHNAVLVRGEDGKASIMLSQICDDSFAGKSELIVERKDDKGTVRALRLPDAGLVISYPAPKAERPVLAQAPALIQRLPVLMARK